MTTLYPRAVWREVTDESHDPPIIPVGCILHVSGGEAKSLFDYFDGPSGGIESHLHVARGPKPDGGGIEQYRDLDNEADANWEGNSWKGSDGRLYGYHSCESQGIATGPWTAYQVEEIAQFLAWDSKRYGYPLRLCRDPKDPGVGWHVMWGAPGAWTPARGKVCPGPDRIKQVPAVIARAQAIAASDGEDDEMSAEAERQIGELYKHLIPDGIAKGQTTVGGTIAASLGTAQGLVNQVAALGAGGTTIIKLADNDAQWLASPYDGTRTWIESQQALADFGLKERGFEEVPDTDERWKLINITGRVPDGWPDSIG